MFIFQFSAQELDQEEPDQPGQRVLHLLCEDLPRGHPRPGNDNSLIPRNIKKIVFEDESLYEMKTFLGNEFFLRR